MIMIKVMVAMMMMTIYLRGVSLKREFSYLYLMNGWWDKWFDLKNFLHVYSVIILVLTINFIVS